MEKRKVIIDCDPGIDDALALLLALKSEELDVLGITICSGNVPTSMGAKNTLKVLELCGRMEIPVYVGEALPLERELVTAQDTHGEDGLGDMFYGGIDESLIHEGGVQFILDTLRTEKRYLLLH